MPHTPGPWELLRYEGHSPQNDYPGRVVAQDGTSIFAGPFSFRSLRGRTSEEAEANARLIAAAPDLLAALKKYVDADRYGSKWSEDLHQEAVTAIAKAEGK